MVWNWVVGRTTTLCKSLISFADGTRLVAATISFDLWFSGNSSHVWLDVAKNEMVYICMLYVFSHVKTVKRNRNSSFCMMMSLLRTHDSSFN
jgi:hypothetical protein